MRMGAKSWAKVCIGLAKASMVLGIGGVGAPLCRGDILPAPGQFDGSCLCFANCKVAYLNPEPSDPATGNAIYNLKFKTKLDADFKARTLSEAHAWCATHGLAPHSVDAQGTKASFQQLTSQLCRNGGTGAGACTSETDCQNVQCVAAFAYRRSLP